MDFQFTLEQEKFRAEVREFLQHELREGTFERRNLGRMVFSREFSRRIAEKGWIGLTWPKEYGGQGRSHLDRLVLAEELLRSGAPVGAHWFADRQIGPAILAYGSEEQKQEFIPRITRGEIFFCVGMSEPEAGSDLASLQTCATEDNGNYVIKGQKVWTTFAHEADYIYLVARTDPSVPKHKGISEFIVDLKLPGINIHPLIDMTGTPHFNEVFFDDVYIHESYLIGQKNRGWYQIAAQLDYERSGIERLMDNYPMFSDIIQYVKENRFIINPEMHYRLAELVVEFEVGRLLCYRIAWMLSQGKACNYEAAMAIRYSDGFAQKLANTATHILGLYSHLLPCSQEALLKGEVGDTYLFSPSLSLGAGTPEILGNIIAIRGLGLPVA